MQTMLRIIVSVVAGLAGAAAAFGLVALAFHVTKHDPGIGGGLIALAAAIVALPMVGGLVFNWMSQPTVNGPLAPTIRPNENSVGGKDSNL